MGTIQIRYTGSAGTRELGKYVWDAGNHYVVAVDVATASELITYPRPGQFALVAGQEPAAADVKKLAGLLGVGEDEVKKLFAGAAGAVVQLPTLADVGLKAERAEELAGLGIRTLDDLAKLDEKGIEELAPKTGASQQEIEGWAEKARELLAAG